MKAEIINFPEGIKSLRARKKRLNRVTSEIVIRTLFLNGHTESAINRALHVLNREADKDGHGPLWAEISSQKGGAQ